MIKNLLESTSLHALFRKSQFTIFAITFVICSFTFVTISIFTMETYARQNLHLISETLVERIEPAVVFNDKHAVSHMIDDYTKNHAISSIEVFDRNQVLIAESIKNVTSSTPLQTSLDNLFLKEPVKLSVFHKNRKVGEVLLFGSSEKILQFIRTILLGLAIAMIFIVVALWLSINLTYNYIVKSLRPIMQIAQLVSDQKAYNLRFPKNSIKEFQNLNEVFNELLEEIHIWHTHLQKENRQLSFQAKHDQLTELPNRHYFHQKLLEIFQQEDRRNHSVLVILDNNNFKDINDQYGHPAGDQVLIEMTKRLKERLRQDDFIARLGGDEFAIILHDIHKNDALITIAENLIQCCEQPLAFEKHLISFSFSLGVAFSKYASSPEDLIMQADQAMYKAKNLNQHWFIYKSEI